MTKSNASLLVHSLTNKLQAILGYIELGEYVKVAQEIKDAIKLLGKLRKVVAGLMQK